MLPIDDRLKALVQRLASERWADLVDAERRADAAWQAYHLERAMHAQVRRLAAQCDCPTCRQILALTDEPPMSAPEEG
jgi:hypothetical protein